MRLPSPGFLLAVVLPVLAGCPEEKTGKLASPPKEKAGGTSLADKSDPKVYLNHAYLVVDEKTQKDIAESDFLKNEFAGFAQRTTKTGEGLSWSGVYIYGERTYLEFFPPGALETSEKCGIGFGVEDAGTIKVVRDRFARLAGKPVDVTLQTRVRDKVKIPWFHLTALPTVAGATLERWVMEYHPEYLPAWNPAFPAGADPLSRRNYLADRYKSDRSLRNIVGLTIALEEDERRRFRNELASLGYLISSAAGRHIARGPELEIVLVPTTTEASGIIEVRMTLNRLKAGASEYRFGPRSVLRFRDDHSATWTFHGMRP